MMNTMRILTAIYNNSLDEKLKSLLSESGFLVIDQVKDGSECLRKIRALTPDVLLLEYNLPTVSGAEVSRIALEDKICDVMMLVTADQDSMLTELKKENGFISLVKPINKTLLVSSLELMVKNRHKIQLLEKELEELKLTLGTRKEVEIAKGLLMKNLGLTENVAFKKIQKQSMDKGIPMKEIAKAIILAYDI